MKCLYKSRKDYFLSSFKRPKRSGVPRHIGMSGPKGLQFYSGKGKIYSLCSSEMYNFRPYRHSAPMRDPKSSYIHPSHKKGILGTQEAPVKPSVP